MLAPLLTEQLAKVDDLIREVVLVVLLPLRLVRRPSVGVPKGADRDAEGGDAGEDGGFVGGAEGEGEGGRKGEGVGVFVDVDVGGEEGGEGAAVWGDGRELGGMRVGGWGFVGDFEALGGGGGGGSGEGMLEEGVRGG